LLFLSPFAKKTCREEKNPLQIPILFLFRAFFLSPPFFLDLVFFRGVAFLFTCFFFFPVREVGDSKRSE
jgi:hypothetical protein